MCFSKVSKVLPLFKSGIWRLQRNQTYFSLSTAGCLNHPSIAQPNQTVTSQIVRNLSSQTSRNEFDENKLRFDYKHSFPLLKEADYKSFTGEYPVFVKDVLSLKELEGVPLMSDEIRHSLNYNVPHGKLLRPMLLLAVALQTQERTGKDLPNLNRIGWTYETINAYSVIFDDVVDKSITRKGRPCWHLEGNRGLYGINTALRMENTMFVLIKEYVKANYPLYTEIIDVLHENTLRLWYGQEIDGVVSSMKEFQRFTPEIYNRMMMSKNSYIIFYTPIILGLMLNGINNPELFKKIEEISMDIGLFYTVQDDFMDCFVDPAKTGKIGTDIQDWKPSWLIMNAIKKATKGQRQILLENYGNNDPDKIALVKNMYEELRLPEAFAEYEKQTNFSLLIQIDELPTIAPKELLKQLVGILNGRRR